MALSFTGSFSAPGEYYVYAKSDKFAFSDIEYRANYIFCRIDKNISHSVTSEIELWCAENSCGKRVSLNHFSFKTEDELTAFTLRWL
jgi:hypothetical protein